MEERRKHRHRRSRFGSLMRQQLSGFRNGPTRRKYLSVAGCLLTTYVGRVCGFREYARWVALQDIWGLFEFAIINSIRSKDDQDWHRTEIAFGSCTQSITEKGTVGGASLADNHIYGSPAAHRDGRDSLAGYFVRRHCHCSSEGVGCDNVQRSSITGDRPLEPSRKSSHVNGCGAGGRAEVGYAAPLSGTLVLDGILVTLAFEHEDRNSPCKSDGYVIYVGFTFITNNAQRSWWVPHKLRGLVVPTSHNDQVRRGAELRARIETEIENWTRVETECQSNQERD
ncbi:hypothetical protein EVAR_67420_1 [Eumeta japonica]|uniref:Uncharacterized protein n=1 Tax=Eumeta variegata TaxID=151549 RepID=A0A4C2AE97_EUMVA|nr:hypothetical protein EVAR_67420_1 [Eumeta japonica]